MDSSVSAISVSLQRSALIQNSSLRWTYHQKQVADHASHPQVQSASSYNSIMSFLNPLLPWSRIIHYDFPWIASGVDINSFSEQPASSTKPSTRICYNSMTGGVIDLSIFECAALRLCTCNYRNYRCMEAFRVTDLVQDKTLNNLVKVWAKFKVITVRFRRHACTVEAFNAWPT